MGEKFDAIVIGTGCAGAGISALLATHDKKILVVEKNNVFGGRNITFDRGEYLVDLGWHFFCLSEKGPHGKICELMGRPDAIPWRYTTTSLLQIGTEPKKYSRKTMFEAVPEGPERDGFARLFDDVFAVTDAELQDLWFVTVDTWVARYTNDPMAKCIIRSFANQYFCVPTSESSAAEFIICFRDIMAARASSYPAGGNAAVTDAFMDAAKDSDATVITGSAVEQILIEGGEVVGVKLDNDETYYSDVVISGADIKSTVLSMAGAGYFPADYVERVEGLTFSNHCVTHRVILSEKVTDKTVVIHIPDDINAPFEVTEEMRKGMVPEIIGGCYSSPTNFDPAMASGGKQIITSAHGCPADISANQEEWEKALMNSFMQVFPEAEGKIEKAWIDSPALVDTMVGEGGSIIGVGQTIEQIRDKRPSVKSPVKGLYLCSADTGSHGIGTELASQAALDLFELFKIEGFIAS